MERTIVHSPVDDQGGGITSTWGTSISRVIERPEASTKRKCEKVIGFRINAAPASPHSHFLPVLIEESSMGFTIFAVDIEQG